MQAHVEIAVTVEVVCPLEHMMMSDGEHNDGRNQLRITVWCQEILKFFAAKMVAQIGQFLVSRSLQTNKKSATGRSTTRTPRRSLLGDPPLSNTSARRNIRFR